jgi:DNA-binding NtrC family response regulator
MARVLIIHGDRSARKSLEAAAAPHHQVQAVGDLSRGISAINKQRPRLVIVGLDVHKKDGLELLRAMRRSHVSVPTIVIGMAGSGLMQPTVMKLGASAFLEYPVEPAVLEQAIARALQLDVDARGEQPPITSEEAQANLTELEAELNRRMKCVAGKNQVYIQSVIVGQLRKTRPRISLKCPLRREQGDPPNVYYEYIRDVCCTDPGACPAWQAFRAKHSA